MRKTMGYIRCLAAGVAMMSPLGGWAQVQSTTGTIQGEVSDPSGGVVPDALIEVMSLNTNATRTAKSDGNGNFSFLSMQPGNYELSASKLGYAKTVQKNIVLTVGQAISLKVALTISSVQETIIVNAVPQLETTTVSSASTLNEITIATTPVLGRKFEDMLTLTPGVSISQGPDGDEININGQRGIFNNISLDGGDYNNGFFGEQMGGQRAAIDITLEAVKEFQVVASGANAEFGRTAGGVVNVITKSGTNSLHGSLFEYQRLQALSADTSNGMPLEGFSREQFGGSIGGAIVKNKLFFFAASEGIRENLTRPNLSTVIGTPCSVTNPVFRSNITDAQIDASGDCQRQTLLNFYKMNFNQDEGLPVDRTINNVSVFGRVDYNLNAKNLMYGSYNFDRSRNPNQTFDVATYGNSANGIEGPSKIQTFNYNWIATISAERLNEAHYTYAREPRPRTPIDPKAVGDTGIGFAPSFRFGQPFFLGADASEIFTRSDMKDNFTLVKGRHTIKAGGEYLHSRNVQVFPGFFNGRYIFGSVTGFLHYASPASLGNGYGPNTVQCPNGTYSSVGCGTVIGSSPLLLYLQNGPTKAGETNAQAGYSNIVNEEYSLFAQDTWKLTQRFTLNYGLRWESQLFPDPVTPPALTAYGQYLNNPAFPSTGYLRNQTKLFQPRVGFAWDLTGNGTSVFRASWGIFNARQNMLTQVGAITTNGVQNQQITQFAGVNPTYPNILPLSPQVGFPPGIGVTVFDRNYSNPRIYTTNVGYQQQLFGDVVGYLDFTLSKGVYLTRFLNPNVGPTAVIPQNADTVSYTGPVPFPNLGAVTNTISNAKSLYRGFTVGFRKRMTRHFLFDGNYVYSVDKDDDSNERDPFTFRYGNLYNLKAEYSNSDRDERHKFNFYLVGDGLPWGFSGNIRMQAHSAQPITDNVNGTGIGAPCSPNNSITRFVNGIDCGRNHLRKNNEYFTLDLGIARPFRIHDRFDLIPRAELFNAFNNANNVNPLTAPALFDFNGFLRVGVGDPLQAQLSLRFTF
ncbi:TonB-dependent receptor [Edaphobacter aggregans]|uniref:TonB-dependent receptor n=1 Tax=Edaphobacter aggregans TaxID=570835 RepID=UPI001FE179A0|nr:carboxypeptidase regulatory-like domain-containing protein [Edaphobacter aggregans]